MLSKPSTCEGCSLYDIGAGFMRPSGSGHYGVMAVAESLGKDEVAAGIPFQGKAGFTLEKLLKRAGLDRDGFRIINTVWCQPPNNKLLGMPYTPAAIEHCAQYSDKAIEAFAPRCIITLGAIAFRRILPDIANLRGVGLLESKKHKGAVGYVFWSEKYNCWVIPSIHPSFILRGQTAWAQVLIYNLQRSVEIARDGYSYDTPDYTLDCTPSEALRWVEQFEAYHSNHPDLYLSCDIETPEKGANEEDLDLEDGSDYTILRCGYSYRDGHGLSIPWGGPFQVVHERLLNSQAQKVWWNGGYDIPRILSQGVVIGGASHDGMDAWHVLNSDLKKSLGFVTPFFRKRQQMWKHLSGAQPAYYNCVDADAAGGNMRGTVELLKKHKMWDVYNEFICELDPVFSAMSRAGMPIDVSRRVESSKQLIERRGLVRERLQSIVPEAIKPITPKNGYVREPKDLTGLRKVVFNGVRRTVCSVCGVDSPKKSHFKVRSAKFCPTCGGKWTRGHIKRCAAVEAEVRSINPCAGANAVEKLEGEERWAKVHPFIPSTKGIMRYQEWNKHPLIFTGRGDDRKATTDEKAIKSLIGKHPGDQFYPLVLEDREYTKLGGTYIGWFNPSTGNVEGGFPLGRDGRIHGVFRHNPSTLRSSMVSPNLQNLPRGDDSEVQKWVKAMFVAGEGHTFVASDFGGIEAILVGREANSRDYVKLARSDVHSYFTAMNLIRQGILTHADEPQLSWSEKDLKEFGQRVIKARFNAERNIGKRCIHAGNYRVGSTKLHEEYPVWFPRVKDAAQVLGFYYEVFPAIAAWHEQLCLRVDRDAVVRNSFGHTHRFYQVLNWSKRDNKWDWDYGDDAKRLIAFGPQSDAAFVGKRALKRCYFNYPESMARWLRLFIHDEIFTECPTNRADEAASILQFEMEQPVPELIMDESWGYGKCLSIATEGKRGASWDKMK